MQRLLITTTTAVLLVMAWRPSVPTESRAVSDSDAGLVGDWRGQSVCVVRESACRDEDSLYHVTRIEAKPGWFAMKLDKIVDGKPVTMGTTDCSFDSQKRALSCEFPCGVLRFALQGDKLVGTMTLTDGTLWRKISLAKA